MDDYALQQELEALAGNAYNPDLDTGSPSELMSTTINRWRSLFGLSQDEATERIMAHRNDLTRSRVTDAHWSIVKAEKEAQGYDLEAYEYELELQKKQATLRDLLPTTDNGTITYLVEMAGPLETPEKVRLAAGMSSVPEVVGGQSVEEQRAVWLCSIDDGAKRALLQWAAQEGKGFEPTILVNPKTLR